MAKDFDWNSFINPIINSLLNHLQPTADLILELFTNILDNKIMNIEKFMEIILLYLKKIQKNTTMIKITKEKLYLDDFDLYLQELPDKFINWVII